MTNTLILYSTVDGQTKKICDYLGQTLAAHHQQPDPNHTAVAAVKVMALDDFESLHHLGDASLADYDTVVLGASIRYGKHRPNVVDFVTAHRSVLQHKHTAFFSVNLVARKPEKNTAQTNSYVQKFLAQVQWQPTLADVFAGQLDYARYGIFDKIMIKFIMWVTKGPIKSDKPIEFTDWQRVKAFSDQVAAW